MRTATGSVHQNNTAGESRSLTVLFVWSIFSPWGVVWGSIPLAVGLTAWFWPKRSQPSLGGANEPT